MLDVLPTLSDQHLRTEPDPEAGFGALTTAHGPLPLIALDVRARLDGLVAGIEVCQTFLNSHDQPVEATYVFPLPDRAAVTSFRLEVAGRVVEGELQERGQARRQYDAALQAGHRAAIAEEERPGVFTMRVGNLPPGERAVVRLALVGPLPCSDGEATFRFPLVVAPRYIPGTPLPDGPPAGDGSAADTDRVHDASRISPPVLLPGFPSPVRLSLSVLVPDSPLAPQSFRSSLHTVVEQPTRDASAPGGRVFRLQPGERLDRDFILRWRLAGEDIQTALAVRPDDEGEEGTFLLTLVPPQPGDEAQVPRDVVFILDRSGSMSGWKMVAARRAVARMVDTLTERDRFTVYAFDDRIETPPGFDGLALVPASDRQRFRAAEFLATVEDRGGTEMAEPLDRAVTELTRTPGEPGASATGGRVDRVLVLITDGQVGNEDEILRRLGPRVQGIRIFTLGIDRAVNAAFLRRLADLGGGASEVVESEARLDEVMDQVNRHVGTPVLTGLSLVPAGLDVVPDSVVPTRLPDLFAGAPVQVSGRYRGPARGAVVLRGQDAQGQRWAAELLPTLVEKAPLDRVWARGRVRELEDRYVIRAGERSRLEKEIVTTSLRFGVLSRFTAFVAVDRAEVVNPGGEHKNVIQAVEHPAGWGQLEALDACPAAPGPMVFSASVPADARTLACMMMPTSPPQRRPSAPPQSAARGAAGGFASHEEDSPDLELGELDRACRELDIPPAGEEAWLGEAGPTRGRKKARKAGKDPGGLWQRIKNFFGVSDTSPAPPPDLQALRTRGEAIRVRLEDVVAGDDAARLAALRATANDLTALVRDLLAAGDRSDPVSQLAALVVALPALLQAAAPPAGKVQQSWQNIVAALREWLGLPAAGAAGSREGFWK
jgi:Ca-activated chloride channel family protein